MRCVPCASCDLLLTFVIVSNRVALLLLHLSSGVTTLSSFVSSISPGFLASGFTAIYSFTGVDIYLTVTIG